MLVHQNYGSNFSASSADVTAFARPVLTNENIQSAELAVVQCRQGFIRSTCVKNLGRRFASCELRRLLVVSSYDDFRCERHVAAQPNASRLASNPLDLSPCGMRSSTANLTD